MEITKTGKVFIIFDLETSRPIRKAADMSLIEDYIVEAVSKSIKDINDKIKLTDNKNVTIKSVEGSAFYTFAPFYKDE